MNEQQRINEHRQRIASIATQVERLMEPWALDTIHMVAQQSHGVSAEAIGVFAVGMLFHGFSISAEGAIAQASAELYCLCARPQLGPWCAVHAMPTNEDIAWG